MDGPSQVDSSDTARHAVVIVMDAVRGDAIDQADTPVFDGIARRGVRVDRAWACSTWTVPSIISLFTGSFSRTHGWDLPVGSQDAAALPSIPTLAEVLHDAGFQTQGYYSNGYLEPSLGFNRGFDGWNRTVDARVAEQVRGNVAMWQKQEESLPEAQRPRHFLYVHLLGCHSGLNPSPEAQSRWKLDPGWFTDRNGLLIDRAKRGNEPGVRDAYRQAYLAVLEDVDANVGAILAAWQPYLADSIVVVTADHGEELGERGVFGHGWSVAEALTHVPLAISGPGISPGRRATATVGEIASLVTGSLGVEHDWPIDTPWKGPLAAERQRRLAILADGRWKGTWLGDVPEAAFDISFDPSGLSPDPKAATPAHEGRERWSKLVPVGSPVMDRITLPEKTLEDIRALGYIE